MTTVPAGIVWPRVSRIVNVTGAVARVPVIGVIPTSFPNHMKMIGIIVPATAPASAAIWAVSSITATSR